MDPSSNLKAYSLQQALGLEASQLQRAKISFLRANSVDVHSDPATFGFLAL